jgi:hypothetical protein
MQVELMEVLAHQIFQAAVAAAQGQLVKTVNPQVSLVTAVLV